MVGRLVHQKHIVLLQHELAEDQALLLAPGHHLDRLAHLVAREEQPPERAAHDLVLVGNGFPAAHPVGEDLVLGEIGRVFLRAVPGPGLVGPADLATVRLEVAPQAAQQRGLADPVGAEDGDLLAGFDDQVEGVEEGLAVALGEILDLHGMAVELFLLVVVEADERVLARGRLHVFHFQLFDLLLARGGLAGLGLVGREARHEILQVGDALLRLGVRVQHLLARLGRGQHVVVVAARVDADAAVVEVGHVRAHRVQEVAVVRDDDDRALALVEHVLQPADRVDVEVVGRLVEQQDVRVRKQRLREQDPQLPPRGDGAHRAAVLLLGDAEAEEERARARLRVVSAVLGELRLEVGGLHVVVLGGVGVRVDRVALGHGRPHLLVAHQHDVEYALVFVGELVLAQAPDALVGVDGDVARRGLQFAAEDLHERGLAAAVGADQAVAVAAAELDRDVIEQGPGPVLHGDAGCGDHDALDLRETRSTPEMTSTLPATWMAVTGSSSPIAPA